MTTTNPPIDLDAIRRRVEDATPGPWVAISDNGRKTGVAVVGRAAMRGTGKAIAVFAGVDGDRHADAAFTAYAREDVPALIAEVERLREVADAAVAWRRMRADTPTKPKPESAALIDAVDRLTEGER